MRRERRKVAMSANRGVRAGSKGWKRGSFLIAILVHWRA
jgi:hypothetical protein